MTPDVAPWRDDVRYAMKPDKQVPTRAKIEGDMRRKWDSVLYFLVDADSTRTGVQEPIQSVVTFMEQVNKSLWVYPSYYYLQLFTRWNLYIYICFTLHLRTRIIDDRKLAQCPPYVKIDCGSHCIR
jgi:hypothetical protein